MQPSSTVLGNSNYVATGLQTSNMIPDMVRERVGGVRTVGGR